MTRFITQIRVLLCFAFVCLITGFCVAASAPDNVFVGIAVMIIGSVFAFAAIIPAAKMIKEQNKQKEDRIKKLEKEVELLKKEIIS